MKKTTTVLLCWLFAAWALAATVVLVSEHTDNATAWLNSKDTKPVYSNGGLESGREHKMKLKLSAPESDAAPAPSGKELPVEVLEHGLQGRVHQESGYAVWQESLILVGGTSLTQAQGLQLFHEMSHQESVDGYSGTRQVTVFNMSDRSVADGPDLPLRSNHGMAAMSAEGRLHALVAGTYLLASDDPAQNGWLHHLVWDFAGGGAGWEERAPLAGLSGGGRCEFVGRLLYCFGGAMSASSPAQAGLHIYDGDADAWREGPPMLEALDHLASVVHDGKIWVTAGKRANPVTGDAAMSWKAAPSNMFACFDPAADAWTPLAPLPFPRNNAAAVVIRRQGKRPTMAAIGGQALFNVRTGLVFAMVEEYDFEEDAWFCHEAHLPRAFQGASVGAWRGGLFLASGAEAFHLAGTDRVQVLDTDALALLEPVPCLYQDRVRARWWEDATAGRLRGNFPYRKHFLRDEELPAPVFRKLMGSLTK